MSWSSSHIKVIGSRSRSQEKRACLCVLFPGGLILTKRPSVLLNILHNNISYISCNCKLGLLLFLLLACSILIVNENWSRNKNYVFPFTRIRIKVKKEIILKMTSVDLFERNVRHLRIELYCITSAIFNSKLLPGCPIYTTDGPQRRIQDLNLGLHGVLGKCFHNIYTRTETPMLYCYSSSTA